MNLRRLSHKAVNTGFKFLQEFLVPITIKSPATSVYDTTTGTLNQTYNETILEALKSNFTLEEIEENNGLIKTTDIKLLIKGEQYKSEETGTYNIDVDSIIVFDNEEYSIIPPIISNISTSMFTLYVRKI